MKSGIVVLASGKGSLFQAILQSESGNQVHALVTDIADCGAVDIACGAGIPVRIVPLRGASLREAWDRDLTAAVAEWNPLLIVCAGFMRILGPYFVDSFPNRIINSHPALLPAFPGAHAVRDALSAGATRTGCTIHFVDHGVDTGSIVAQESVDIHPNDIESELHERIKSVERVLLPTTIGQLLQTINR